MVEYYHSDINHDQLLFFVHSLFARWLNELEWMSLNELEIFIHIGIL